MSRKRRSVKVFGATFQEVPSFFTQSCKIIEDNPREGLFRRCGDKVKLDFLKARIDAGEDVDMSGVHVHNCCALVKQYIREMPVSVFAPLAPWFAIGAIVDRRDRAVRVKERLAELPENKFSFLFQFFTLLYELTQNPTIKMGHRNLGIVFVPNFFGLKDRFGSQNVLETLIRDFVFVFDAASKRRKLFFSGDFSVCREIGIRDPSAFVQVRDEYKAWLQMTKNIGLAYKRSTGGPMFDIYSIMCEEVFINYLRELIRNTKILSLTDEWRVKLYDNVVAAFAEELEFQLSADRYVRKLKKLVNEGIDMMHTMLQLRPVGKFLWVKMGAPFNPSHHLIKNQADEGFTDDREDLFVIRPLYPGFYAKALVFVKCGVLVGTQADLDEVLADEESSEESQEEGD